jgi:hypothetical protein
VSEGTGPGTNAAGPLQVRVKDLRLSFVWVETVLDSFRSRPAAADREESEFDFLKLDYRYERTFEEVLQGGSGRENLEPPWRDHESPQRFWTYYLGEPAQLSEVTGRRAYKSLVPLRGRVPVKLGFPAHLPISRHTVEAFYYPHGLALVITASWNDIDLTLSEATGLAIELQSTRQLEYRWRNERREYLPLREIARRTLTKLRKNAFLPRSTAEARSASPFTVLTVVKGCGVDPAVATSSEIYRQLQAAIAGRRIGGTSEEEFRKSRLDVKSPASQGDLLYGLRRGRAIWFPSLFTHRGQTLHSLGCYHRNLVFASLQVESLGMLISETVKQRQNGKDYHSPDHRDCARQAAAILGRLHEGDYRTYRSWSCRAQIEHNNLKKSVNEIRGFFDMPLLPLA